MNCVVPLAIVVGLGFCVEEANIVPQNRPYVVVATAEISTICMSNGVPEKFTKVVVAVIVVVAVSVVSTLIVVDAAEA